ncbi:MAG: transporter, family, hexuronate transporter [Candidatus Hydrogenedentes bacterium]|nr:transporter, family, hexuronate transporter [Candidatus Hydrogenedentota bacterium]
MPSTEKAAENQAVRPIRHLRWWIGGMLFAVTVINYLDRQTLSALSPYLKEQYQWTNTDYAYIVNAFQISYTIMQTVVGRLLDTFGTRTGIGVSVLFYSTIGALTATAMGIRSFCAFRFLLGAGEAANNPGGSKAVSEWFPAKERAWAVALFNSGCAVGGMAAPFVVLFIYKQFDSWRPCFLITAFLGFAWWLVWRKLYRTPETHPRISAQELAYIQAGRSSSAADIAVDAPRVTWLRLLSYRQTWGLILGRFLLDPFWFFVANWYGIYLKSKGFSLEQSVLGSSAPFLCAGLGNFVAGALSSYLVSRGWPAGKSRRTVLLIFGPSMFILISARFTGSYTLLLLIFAYAAFAYNCCGTMFLTLPTDVFHTRAVGTVMGLAGTSAGISTFITTQLIGWVSDTLSDTPESFGPIIIAASILPCLATIIFVTMVRASKKPDPHGILPNF